MKKKIWYGFFAFLIAVAIWYQINLLREQNVVINVPMRISNISDNFYILNRDELRVPIRVVGSGIYILIYYLSNPFINYNGAEMYIGSNVIDLSDSESILKYHPKLRFNIVQSDEDLVVEVDRVVQKRVPVIFDFVSERDRETLVSSNYIFDDVYISISGPESEINKIDYVHTEKINADAIKPRSPFVRLKYVNDFVISTLELQKISDIISTRTLALIPIEHDTTKISLFPQRVSVKIEGKLDSLNALSSEDITAYVLGDLFEDDSDVNIHFRKPDHIKILDFTPQKVNVRVNNN